MKNKSEIEVKPLGRTKRHLVFILSLVLFVVAVPVSVFYAIGYRFDFSDNLDNIKSVGGMYVTNETDDTEMFIDNEPVEDMRVFRRAAYIQNLEAGIHRIHVQGDSVQTWVKDLPVYAHFVTEVASFNVPEVPQVRVITPWVDPVTDEGVVLSLAATSSDLSFASTTNTIWYRATTSTSSLRANTEYTYVKSLFASSTEQRKILERLSIPRQRFGFDVPTTTQAAVATTTKQWRDVTLFKKDEEVIIAWEGDQNDIPHYYCIRYLGEKRTTLEYGKHVYEALKEQAASITDLDDMEGERICRMSIRIDRLNQEVLGFDFYPDSTDIVLMHLRDGLYAVEVDDRAWQNTQILYPGTDINVVLDGGRIYVQDGDYYLEIFTEIASQA